MAKYEDSFDGNLDEFLNIIEKEILNGSISATIEDSSNFSFGEVFGEVICAVRVYERYSMAGSGRVSLNLTLLAKENKIHLSAITSGGSQAIFFKFNTYGEESFLECLVQIVVDYKNKMNQL